jgi:hypothetical protein
MYFEQQCHKGTYIMCLYLCTGSCVFEKYSLILRQSIILTYISEQKYREDFLDIKIFKFVETKINT